MRWLILMTKENLVKCREGLKTQTRRGNARFATMKAGDEIFFRCGYKDTYATAEVKSGKYIATADARWERLQNISEADVKAEGVSEIPWDKAFEWLWKSINKKKHTWESNPNVVRIEFKKVVKP